MPLGGIVVAGRAAPAALAGDGRFNPGSAAAADVIAARAAIAAGDLATAVERLKKARSPSSRSVRPWVDLLLLETSAAAGMSQDELEQQRERLWKDAERLTGKVERARFDQLARMAELKALLKVTPKSDATVIAAKALFKAERDDPDALALVARALDSGEGDQARQRLLVDHPEHPEALALEPADPSALPLNQAARVRRVEQLISASRMERALLEVQALPTATDGPLDVALEVVRIKALVRNDKAADAVTHAEALVARQQDADLLDAHAWALGKADRPKDATAAYQRLMDATAGDPSRRGDACFFAGFLLFEAALDDDAVAQWERCRTVPDEKSAPLVGHQREADAVWYTALAHLTASRFKEAAALLRRFEEQFPTYDEIWKVRYWRAIALLRSGDRTFGSNGLGSITVRADPQTYYWHLARRTLGRRDLPRGAKVPADALLNKAAHGTKAKRTLLLHHLGFQAAARASLRDRQEQDARTLGLAQAIGAWDFAYRRNLRVRPRSYISSASKRAAGWRASYPRPWSELVEKAAKEHGISADFVYAIMRTESAFDPDITSRVGARGLLQLMPYTARGMAEQLKVTPPAPDDLYRPDVVIPLGTAFLAISQKELGSLALSAAAYNGGPRNVARWMKHFGHLPPELFVERIAFKETRNYVKKTAVTAMMYSALEGGPLVIDLPTAPVGPPPATFTWFDPSNNE